MRDVIRKILSEGDMEWAKSVPTAFPSNSDILGQSVQMEVYFNDYLRWNYDYSFVTLFFEDTESVVEFVMENDTVIKKYNNISEIDGEEITTMEEYVDHHGQDELVKRYDRKLFEFISKSFPFKLKGVYQGYL
jgi:hypothetical protein